MNALTQTNNTTLARADDFDPFAEYANAMGGNRIVGTLLKFSKGDYLVGQNGDIMEEGTQLAANVEELLVGWIKWKDKKPVEQIMGKLADRFVVAKRDTLGDLDESTWEVDKDGKAQDPWQYTNYLVLKVPGLDDQDGLYTFTTSSKGGVQAVSKLCGLYSKMNKMRSRGPNGEKDQPIIKLGVERYQHKEYGWLKNPSFTIVGWAGPNEFAVALEQDAAQAKADAAAREEADKDIPF
jgi:hypothetical protein